MAVKPIIIPLVADTAGLTVGIEALEQLGTIDAKTASDFKAASKAFADRGKVLDQSATSTDKLASASKKLVESIAGGAIAQATANIQKFNQQIDNTNADFIALNKTVDLAKKQLSGLQQGTPAFNKLSAEIHAAELAMGNFGKEATSSRAQLRQYREALTQLEDAGLDSTQVFHNMALAAGELQDQVGDTQQRIKALSSDTFALDATIGVVQGLAGAFSIAQGAAGLLGDENEDLQKSLLKVNSAMAILSGLQQLQNTLQRQSTAVLGIEIAAQKLYALVVGESTGAMKVFRIALASTGIGLLVIALGALIANFDSIKRSIVGGVSPALQQLSKDKQKVVDAAEKAAEASSLEERQLKATGATDTEVLKVRVKNIQTLIKALQAQLAIEQIILTERQNAFIKESAFLAANQASPVGVPRSLLELIGFGSPEEVNKQQEKVQEVNDKLKEGQVSLQEALKEIQDIGIKDSKKAQDDSLKATQKFLKDQIDATEAAVIEAKGGFEKLEAQINHINAKLRYELANPDLGPNGRLLAELKANEEIRKARQDLLGDIQILSTNQTKIGQKAIQDEVLTSAQGAAQRLAVEQAAAQERIRLTEQEEQEKKQIRERALETALQTASSLASSITTIAQNNADAQIAIEQQRLEQGLITQQQFDQRSRSIRRRAAQEEKQLAIFQAGIALSLAILSVLKDQTIPPPAKPIFIALASVAALAQIAAIQSKPIPAFKGGTKDAPGGPSLVGEAGPELIYSNGNWQYANRATVLDLPKHAKVIPTLDTQRILSKYDIPMPSVQQYVNTSIGGVNIDYRKLGMAVGKEIAKLPLQQNNWDENGYNSYQTSVAGRKSYLNTKYRSPR